MVWLIAEPLREVHAMLLLFVFYPKKAITRPHSSSEFMARWRRKLSPSLTAFSGHPCLYAWEEFNTLLPPFLLSQEKP